MLAETCIHHCTCVCYVHACVCDTYIHLHIICMLNVHVHDNMSLYDMHWHAWLLCLCVYYVNSFSFGICGHNPPQQKRSACARRYTSKDLGTWTNHDKSFTKAVWKKRSPSSTSKQNRPSQATQHTQSPRRSSLRQSCLTLRSLGIWEFGESMESIFGA